MKQRYLGIDYGSRKTGIAVSDPLNIIATALTTIPMHDHPVEKILSFVEEYHVGTVVVGMPLNLKGEKGQKALETEQFVTVLTSRLPCPVITWDERFTTKMAHDTLRAMGIKKKVREKRENIDARAAAFILQSFLDSKK